MKEGTKRGQIDKDEIKPVKGRNKLNDLRTDLPPVWEFWEVWSGRPSEPRCPPPPVGRLHEHRTPPWWTPPASFWLLLPPATIRRRGWRKIRRRRRKSGGEGKGEECSWQVLLLSESEEGDWLLARVPHEPGPTHWEEEGRGEARGQYNTPVCFSPSL